MDLGPEEVLALKYESELIMDLDLCWQPHQGQKLIKNALFGKGHKTVFLECGRKFGKTETLAYLLYRYALSFPNAACYFIAPFQKQARELIWANNRLQNFFMPLVDPKVKRTHKGHTTLEAHQIMEELNEKYGVKINDSEMRIRFGNGSFIKLDGADNHQAYRGVNPHLIVYDEFKDHHPKFHTGMEPNLATFEAPLIIVGTPCEGDESNEKSFNSIADYAKLAEDQAYFQLPTAINPHISKDWLRKKRKELFAKGEDDKWYREYCALRVKAGQKSIFPMLDKTIHTMPEKSVLSIYGKHRKDYDIFCGFDPASSSTFSVVLVAIHKYNKRILVLDEIYERNKVDMSTRPIWIKTQKMLSKWNIREDDVRFIYDYAAAWFANEVADKFNVGLEPCYKDIGKNKEKRLSLIKDCLLLDSCFIINEDTINEDKSEGSGLFWEMQNYRVDDKGKIPKENDHAIDTLRYILSNAHYDDAPVSAPGRNPDDMRRAFTPDQDLKERDGSFSVDEEIYSEFYE